MRTCSPAFQVATVLAATALITPSWGEGLSERASLEGLTVRAVDWPARLGSWPPGWVAPDLSQTATVPRLQWGRVRVTPSLFSSDGSLSGGGVWFGQGDTWRLAVGSRRQPAKTGLGFTPGMGETSLVTASYVWADRESLSLQWVRQRDSELGQRTLHLVYGTRWAGNQSMKFGLSAISGWEPVGGSQQRVGLSVGYDWPSYFVKVAYDPQVNFTARDEVRVSWGTRF